MMRATNHQSLSAKCVLLIAVNFPLVLQVAPTKAKVAKAKTVKPKKAKSPSKTKKVVTMKAVKVVKAAQ